MPNSFRLLIARLGARPCSVRGRFVPIATARKGDAFGSGLACRKRLSQPSVVLFTPGVKSTTDGWLNRFLQAKPDPKASPFRAVAMGTNLPRTLQGRAPSLAINNLNEFGIRGGGQAAAVQGGFEALYEQSVNDVL